MNGALRSLQPDAQQVSRAVATEILQRWPTFGSYFQQVLKQIEEHYRAVAARSAAASAAKDEEAAAAEEVFDFPRYVLPLFGEQGWVEPNHICSPARARILAVKLEAHMDFGGFLLKSLEFCMETG